MRACECLCLSLLSTIRWQESDKRHSLSLATSGVRSCLFGSGTSRLHTMMFQTFTYMGVCMSVCMCVCSGACLHRCTYTSRTHNIHIHAHATHARVHVYTAVCACHAHTTHTYTHTQHTLLFRSLCLYFSSVRTPGGTACWHLRCTGPRSRVGFFVKTCQGHVVSL